MEYRLNKTIQLLKTSINNALNGAYKDIIENTPSLPKFEIEIPSETSHGNLSANVAMVYAKVLKNPV